MASCFVVVVMVFLVNLELATRVLRLCVFVVVDRMVGMSPGPSVDLETSRVTGIVMSICSTLGFNMIFF